MKMLSVSQLFSLAKQGYAANFKRLLLLALIPYGLVLLTVLVMFLENIGLGILAEGPVRTIFSGLTILLSIATYIFLFIMSNLAAIAMMMMIKEGSSTMSIRQALAKARFWFWSYVWVSVLTAILLLLWSFLFIIPAIIMAGYYSMAIWILLEGQYRGYGAIKQSKILVRGYWWAIFWRQLVLVVLALVFFLALAFISWSVYGPASVVGDQEGQGSELFNVFINIISALVMPFYMIYFYNIYKSLVEIKKQAIGESSGQ